MSKIIAIALLLCIGINSKAQDFTYFNQTYGGNDTINILAQITQPVSDGFIIIGNYASLNTPHAIYIMKINNYGEQIWFKNLFVGDDWGILESGTAICSTTDGQFVATTVRDAPQGNEIYLFKFNEDGDTLWSRHYPSDLAQVANMVIQTSDGGFALAGLRYSTDTIRMLLLKTDETGIYQWHKTYEIGNDTRAFSIQQYYDDTYILGGWGYTTATKYDMFVVKTQANGDTIWTKRFGGVQSDCGSNVVNLNTYEDYLNGVEPSYLVAGCKYFGSIRKLYVSKIGNNGSTVWQKTYNVLFENSNPQALPIVLPDKGFIFPGHYYNGGGGISPYIMRFNSIGNLVWTSLPIASNNEMSSIYIKDMQPIPGGYVLAGYQYNIPQTAWVFTIDSLGNTCGSPPCVETVVGLPEIVGNEQAAATFSLSPNPAQGSLVLTWLDPTAALGSKAVILDITGKQVHTFNVSSPSTLVDVSRLAAGMYFVQVANTQEVQKLVVILKTLQILVS